MANTDWADLSRYEFFLNEESPSQKECESFARLISKASDVCSVNSSNATSHSVICSGGPEDQSVIVTFRTKNHPFDDDMVRRAYNCFGDIAPKPVYSGVMKSSRQPLSIYITPCQLGSPLLGLLPCATNLTQPEIARQVQIMRGLAR